jgi:polysaccharide export outer membrane protein
MLMSSCNSTEKIVYMQDATIGVTEPVTTYESVVARPNDKVSIVVNCPDPQTAALFALTEPNKTLSSVSGTTGSTSREGSLRSYTIDASGNILMPVLGTVNIGGLTRTEIANKIKNELVSKDLVKEPVVIVEFTNLYYTVTGEVKSPGRYNIINERTTILEALAQAGDLSIYGRRDNVKVVREIDGKRTTYQVDLRSNSLFDSPAYYLQQNDVIYVEPNGTRAGQSSVNENNWKSVSLWMSMASFLMSVVVLIVK